MRLTELNLDVLSAIFSFVERQSDLVTIVKTCKLLRTVAEPHLLANIVLREERRLISLCDTLHGRPDRSKQIQSLRYKSMPALPSSAVPPRLHVSMEELLSMTTNLRHFVLEWPPRLMESDIARTALCSMRYLQSLDLNDYDVMEYQPPIEVDVGALLDELHAPLRSLRVVTGGIDVFPGVLMGHLMNF